MNSLPFPSNNPIFAVIASVDLIKKIRNNWQFTTRFNKNENISKFQQRIYLIILIFVDM